ncbi:DNA-3-methyladenine glycosylase I [Companilactobacillus mishanensis]|uniref:DNA-3-methyladenine glycosylase I n=1 Tax=Companilactobacillus mishanensis TaxID=2486008 RepID=A0ABW9P815_9LACO|nr:DNA-3-methyladenine glycosylase I [Companilactobacillus mishanensis]MQS45293.1 DNA-3-methyladenine glycosylase I [Companilactobacillus mishanensis]MQS90031.1 DNA-3-methyladenine glycosylase I [Companilactobacillus mishanensis]
MRCEWANSSPEMQAYHDNEWCKISHDEKYFFEMLSLELSQAGLSWSTIIKRRQGYNEAFANFDIDTVADFDDAKKAELLQNEGIIRNKLKVNAIINNAKLIQQMHERGEKFSDYIWSFTDGKQIDHHVKSLDTLPAQDELSQKISKDLKKRGFKFVGPTIIYSYLQAVGVYNDHLDTCDFK